MADEEAACGLVRDEAHVPVGPCREQPWLAGVEGHSQHALRIHSLVSLQDFHRHNEWICHQVLRHRSQRTSLWDPELTIISEGRQFVKQLSV